jgi:hypothetical protein
VEKKSAADSCYARNFSLHPGYLELGKITNVSVSGSIVSDNTYTGGIVGVFYSGLIGDSKSAVTITSTGNATNTDGGTSTALVNFYDSNIAPLTSWNFTDTWNSTGAALPTLSLTFLSSSWGTCADHQVDTPFAGGAGTLSNPYLICTAAQMNTIGSSTTYWTNKHYKLMSDISLSTYTGTQYNVIGTAANPFLISSFNGDGHVISDLTFSNAAISYVGLFGSVSSSNIRLLGLSAPAVTGGVNYTGAIAGRLASYAMIHDSYVKGGTVIGQVYAGGLTGDTATRSIMRSSFPTVLLRQVLHPRSLDEM